VIGLILGFGAAGYILYEFFKGDEPTSSNSGIIPADYKIPPNPIEDKVRNALHDATLIPVPPKDKWVEVQLGNEKYIVSPRYIAPIGIGEAVRVAQLHEAQLPTKELVDEIWKQADLKLEPHPVAHDGTPATMNSDDTNIKQLAYIANQIKEKSPNNDYKLLGGTHKDVAYQNGKIGLYGWHKLNGKVIQSFFPGHAAEWKDYSQGARLVKRIT